MQSKIIINNLVGIPASGKTTYCLNVMRTLSATTTTTALHICYDHFIPPTLFNQSPSTSSSLTFKRHRFHMRLLLQQIIDDIRHGTGFNGSQTMAAKLFSAPAFKMQFPASVHSNVLLLIDDNMYYKSMRKEIWNLARSNGVSYFCTYFPVSLSVALERNGFRAANNRIPADHIRHMNKKLEVPDANECLLVISDESAVIVTDAIIEIIEQLKPLSQPPPSGKDAVEEIVTKSTLHRIDLMLRKEISLRLQTMVASARRCQDDAKILCKQRKYILQEIRNGNVSAVCEDEELKLMIGF